MAATNYNVFVKYMNNNKTISEQTEIGWMSYYENYELSKFYEEHKKEYETIKAQLANGTKKKENFNTRELEIYTKCKKYLDFEDAVSKGNAVKETVFIEPFDEMYVDPQISDSYPSFQRSKMIRSMKEAKIKRDTANQNLIVEQTRFTNPKFNMIFMYDGIGKCTADKNVYNPNLSNQNPQVIPYVYYDNMKRVECNPWFFYEQFGSLQAAMTRASELVNIFGKGNVLIGKEVALDQYIDIV